MIYTRYGVRVEFIEPSDRPGHVIVQAVEDHRLLYERALSDFCATGGWKEICIAAESIGVSINE
jgi:hypothetical protein